MNSLLRNWMARPNRGARVLVSTCIPRRSPGTSPATPLWSTTAMCSTGLLSQAVGRLLEHIQILLDIPWLLRRCRRVRLVLGHPLDLVSTPGPSPRVSRIRSLLPSRLRRRVGWIVRILFDLAFDVDYFPDGESDKVVDSAVDS